MTAWPPVPDKERLATLPLFERLGMDRIVLVQTAEQAQAAWGELSQAPAWGFDTESKPTFVKDQVSDGPHVLQLATLDKAWVIQLHDPDCRVLAASWLSHPVVKAGFGLGDDHKRIVTKLQVLPVGVMDLNTSFRQCGYRQDMGVKAAVAVLFEQRFVKSKKAATSNWAQPRLSEAQIVYAANDAYAAARVYHALAARGALSPHTSPRRSV